MALKNWLYLKLQNGDHVHFIPPAPNGDSLGGITETQLTNIDKIPLIEEDLTKVANDITSQKADISQLETALKSGSKDDAVWHLGFYLDDDGYLCQKGDDD